MHRSRRGLSRATWVRFRAPTRLLLAALMIAVASASHTGISGTGSAARTYTNPLHVAATAAGPFESCPDPAIIHGQQPGDTFWYMYCTTNPLNDTDRTASGRLNGHYMPMLLSRDLVQWTYVGDVFSERPPWLAGGADDGNYLKLAHLTRAQTQQVLFTKAVFPVPPRYPHEGNTVVGPAAAWTYLRIVKRTQMGEEAYTVYSSRDGVEWSRGGTWTDALGRDARIGLVAMGGAGFTANFAYVRVYTLPLR
jgi:hypothetical protein